MTKTNPSVEMAPNTMTVYLADHGFFTTTVERARDAERMTKVDLALDIALGYDGSGEKPATRKSYWLAFPKAVLVVVWGDMHKSLKLD